MPKFFVNEDQINGEEVTIVGEDVNHIINVLRLSKGDRVNICDINSKNNYMVEILDFYIDSTSKSIENEGYIKCKIIEKIEPNSESNLYINIFQGLPKADKMELIIQKNVELGVSEITPVEMKRCVVKLEAKNKEKKIERWQKIAETAAKQSGRDTIPKVNKIVNIKNICNLIQNYDIVILAYEEEKNNTLKDELKRVEVAWDATGQHIILPLHIAIIVGPEGGLEKDEEELLKEAGARVVSLGNRILRTETAGLVVTSIIMYELGDLGGE